MGHCIHIFLVRESDLRADKVDAIVSDKFGDVNLIPLKKGILATTERPNKEWSKDKMIAEITTDYFGGMGYQTAKIVECGKVIYDESDEFSFKTKPINEALGIMGIVPDQGKDNFDTIGLGRYRSNEDFNEYI